MIGDAGEYVGEPGLRVDVVELGGGDQRVDRRGALAAAVGTREQPCPAPQGNAAQCALGGVVAQADAAVVRGSG
jgi:hypothetical protein